MILHKGDASGGTGGAAPGRTADAPWYRGLLHLLLFFLPVLISYGGALGTGFFGDDQGRIIGNEDLLGGPLRAVSSGLKDRPVLMFSLWLDVRLWGVSPFALRLMNVFLHSLVGLALWRVLEVMRVRHRPLGSPAGPLLLALFFVLHPIHNQAVNLIVQRGVILSALFMLASLLAFLAFLEGGSRRDLLLSVLGFLLSILSKPGSSFFPLFLLGYLTLTGRLKEKALAVVPHFAVLALPLAFYYVVGENLQLGTVVDRGTYLLTQARVTLLYLKLFFFPYGLHYFYDIEPSLGLLDHYTWAALAVHGLFALLIVRLFRSNGLAAFFFAAVYLALLPESGLFPILHLAFEHRTYIPLLFLTAALAQLPIVPLAPRRAAALFLPLFGVMLILNGIRNREITPREDWIVNTLRHSRSFPSVNLKYTIELFESGRTEDAVQVIERLERHYPGAPIYELLRLVGEYYQREGRRGRRPWRRSGNTCDGSGTSTPNTATW